MRDSSKLRNLIVSLALAAIVHAIAIIGGMLNASATPQPRPRPVLAHELRAIEVWRTVIDGAPTMLEPFPACGSRTLYVKLFTAASHEEFLEARRRHVEQGSCVELTNAFAGIDEFFGPVTIAGAEYCFARVVYVNGGEFDPERPPNLKKMKLAYSLLEFPSRLLHHCVAGKRPRHAPDRLFMPLVHDY